MKKLLFCLFTLLLLPPGIYGNFIQPMAYFSELTFDSGGNWILEIKFYDHPDSIFIDSIFIQTNSGCSKIGHYTAFQPEVSSEYLAVITKDSLVTPLEINRDNDQITIISYLEHTDYDDHFPIGGLICCVPENHSAIVIPHCTETGGFICPWDCRMLDNTPTIGEINTEDGTEATVYGYVYDADHNPVSHASLIAYNGFIQTDEEGYYYTERVSSCTYSFDTTSLWGAFDTYIYEQVYLRVFPDSVYVQDLVLLSVEPFFSVPEPIGEKVVITSYPNPFTTGSTLYISIPEGMIFSNAILELYDNTGRLRFSQPVKEYKSTISLSVQDLALTQGTYHLFLKADGKILVRNQSLVKL